AFHVTGVQTCALPILVLINWSIGEEVSIGQLDRLFFSVFHSVSAFCNAGFSTLPHGLYEAPLRFNYSLHLVIAALVVLGGMGFPDRKSTRLNSSHVKI